MTAGLAIAIPVFLYSVSVIAWHAHTLSSEQSLASAFVSLSVGVPANTDNTTAAQLKSKEDELVGREATLLENEQSLARTLLLYDALPLVSIALSLLLFVLIGLNFYFDVRRRPRSSNPLTSPRAFSVDLRR